MPDGKHGWIKLSHIYTTTGVGGNMVVTMKLAHYNSQTATYLSTYTTFDGLVSAADNGVEVYNTVPTNGAYNILGVAANKLGNGLFEKPFDNSQKSPLERIYLGPMDRITVVVSGAPPATSYLHYTACEFS